MKIKILNNALSKVLVVGLGSGLLVSHSIQAAGPLYTTNTEAPVPLTWHTNKNNVIPVYTDGGEAFTWDYDGVTPFITIDRANEITAFAFDQWNNVQTSKLKAEIAGTIEDKLGIADVDASNADELYFVENGGGIFVIYDTDGDILEEFFGVAKTSVLGIAFPEFSDGEGTIIEATVLINGWNVHVDDTEGNNLAGVFTHEIGHSINLSHSQVNGTMGYFSRSYSPYYPGVPGCVDPIYRWDSSENALPSDAIETMFPFISHTEEAGAEQSTINVQDDIVAISNLYPTRGYSRNFGSISGEIKLKDNTTPYSGINVIARNINDPLNDAISAMSGDQTQGKIGPDGRFTINGLTPGSSYQVYIEPIVQGGFPTTPQALASEAEYWNANESQNPLTDLACDATTIVAKKGDTQEINMVFNGYSDGVEFLPIPQSSFTDSKRNGNSAVGSVGTVSFRWDKNEGVSVIPYATARAFLTQSGNKTVASIQVAGIKHGAVFHSGGRINLIEPIEGAGECVGSSNNGPTKTSVWDIDNNAKNVVGFTYVDYDNDGTCGQGTGEIVPFQWNSKDGMSILDTAQIDNPAFVRAQAISGNGEVIIGSNGAQKGLAWINGEMIDLYAMANIVEANTINKDGRVAALSAGVEGVKLWDHRYGENGFLNIGSLVWCQDLDYVSFRLGNLCEQGYTHDQIVAEVGLPKMTPMGISNDGKVLTGRSGNFQTGFIGSLWTEFSGWRTLDSVMEEQGVVEARSLSMMNPNVLSEDGTTIFGTLSNGTGFRVDLAEIYVCANNKSVKKAWPKGVAKAVGNGARLGRCEFLTELTI